MANATIRYKYIWKWIDTPEECDILNSIQEVIQELFLTGACIDDLEYVIVVTQRWNKTKHCWCSRKSEHNLIYQKSDEDIRRWWIKNDKY